MTRFGLICCLLFIIAFALPARATCSGPNGNEADVIYNGPYHTYQFCNGTNWIPFGASGTAAVPSGGNANSFSFTNLTSQSLNTLVASNTITVTGFTGTEIASVTGAATAQISINGGGWVTSGGIQSGQTLQVRLTTSGSVSTGLTATVTVGSSSTNWTVTTRSASLNVFATNGVYYGSTLGGLSGADADCQAAANAASLSGTYMAIMSDESTNAKDRLTLSYPIVNVYNGLTVATTNLWSGTLLNGITTLAGAGGGTYAWTGSDYTGTKKSGSTCSSWTGGTNGEDGWPGNTTGWIDSGGSKACASSAIFIYCIQQ